MYRLDLIGKRHPLSGTDFKGESSSDTAQTTTSSSTDARVGADNGAVVIQAGGQQNISFSKEVADATESIVNSVYNFGGDTLAAARSVVSDTVQSQTDIVNGAIEYGRDTNTASLNAQASVTNTALNFAKSAIDGLLDFGKTSLAASPATSPAASSAISNTQTVNAMKPLYIVAGVSAIVVIFLLMKRR